MIEIVLPPNRKQSGSLALRTLQGEVLFGPVPVAGKVRYGSYAVSAVLPLKNLIALNEDHWIQTQPGSVTGLLWTCEGLRMLRSHHAILVQLLGQHGRVPCEIRAGTATAFEVTDAPSAAIDEAALNVRRLQLAHAVRTKLVAGAAS